MRQQRRAGSGNDEMDRKRPAAAAQRARKLESNAGAHAVPEKGEGLPYKRHNSIG